MNKSFPLVVLTAATLFSTSSVIAKRFIYDDQTRTYTEIRDDYNNTPYYGQQPSYGQPQQQYNNGRYYIDTNRDQRIDTTMPRPSWDWKKGDKIPEQFRSDRFKVKSNDSPRIYFVGPSDQWFKINSDYVLADHRYKIMDIVR